MSQQDPLGAQSKYRILKNINSGSYGQVQLAVDRTTGEQVAIKLMERGSKITKYVERELINHSHLLHPHIVQVPSRPPRHHDMFCMLSAVITLLLRLILLLYASAPPPPSPTGVALTMRALRPAGAAALCGTGRCQAQR